MKLGFDFLDQYIYKVKPENMFKKRSSRLNHMHIFIGSNTLQFLHFWYQNGVNTLFLVVKPIEVISDFILKLKKKLLDGAAVKIFDI